MDIPIFIPIFFAVFLIVVGGTIAYSITVWMNNNRQPIVSEPARIVARRTRASGDKNGTTTSYYATFEFSTRERREFRIAAREFGLLADGDTGDLSYQGTRYKGFARALR